MAKSEDGPLKIIMGRKSEEGIKIVYDSPKYVRGDLSLLIILDILQNCIITGSWILDKE